MNLQTFLSDQQLLTVWGLLENRWEVGKRGDVTAQARLPSIRVWPAKTRGGHSHRRRSHSCDQGQEAVKGSRAVFGAGQAVKDNFQTQ